MEIYLIVRYFRFELPMATNNQETIPFDIPLRVVFFLFSVLQFHLWVGSTMSTKCLSSIECQHFRLSAVALHSRHHLIDPDIFLSNQVCPVRQWECRSLDRLESSTSVVVELGSADENFITANFRLQWFGN